MRRTPRTPRLLHDVKPHARGWRFRSVVEPLAPITSGQAAAPRPGRLIRTMVIWVALAMVMAVTFLIAFSWSFVGILAQRRGGAPPAGLDGAVLSLTSVLVFQATLLFGAWREARRIGHGNRWLGLAALPIERRGTVAALTALTLLYCGLLVAAFLAVHSAKGGTGLPRIGPDVLSAQTGMVAIVLQGLLLVAVAPLAEELFFRGWLWTGFRAHRSARWTAVVTGLMWMLLHLPDGWTKPLYLIPTAILLSLARHYGNSVRASLLLHIVNNLVAFGLISIGGRWN